MQSPFNSNAHIVVKQRRSGTPLFALALLLVSVTSSDVSPQAVKGVVTMGTTGLVVRGGGVILLDMGGRVRNATLSDSAGNYLVAAPAPGDYKLRVQGATGVPQVETKAVNLVAGSVAELNVTLPAPATTLDTVRVTSTRKLNAPPGNPTKYDDFYRRKELGFGSFLTKEDIAKTGMNQTADIIRKIPGMLVNHEGTTVKIQSKRCDGGTIPGTGEGGRYAKPDRKLEPMLFIDGARVRDIGSIADVVPAQIEAIEVYQGASQVPAEAKGDACAAIFIWLKQ